MTNTNQTNTTDKATKIFNILSQGIEELHPKKVKAPVKPKTENQAKKYLEDKDIQVAIKNLRKEGKSITRIAEVLNAKLRNNFELKEKEVSINMYLKNKQNIPEGERTTRNVTDPKTKEVKEVEFVTIQVKDKFTVTMIQKLLGEKKIKRKIITKDTVSSVDADIDEILAATWTQLSKAKRRKSCKECSKLFDVKELKEGHCKGCYPIYEKIEEDIRAKLKETNLTNLIYF